MYRILLIGILIIMSTAVIYAAKANPKQEPPRISQAQIDSLLNVINNRMSAQNNEVADKMNNKWIQYISIAFTALVIFLGIIQVLAAVQQNHNSNILRDEIKKMNTDIEISKSDIKKANELRKSVMKDTSNYFDFLLTYFNSLIKEENRLSYIETKMIFNLLYAENDSRMDALYFFKKKGENKHIPYLKEIVEMGHPLGSLAQEAILEIQNRKV